MQWPSHAHTAKIEARILKRIERKAGDVPGGRFGFRRGKGITDAIGMQKIILKGNSDMDEELCVRFIDWQKTFDHVTWTKLM